MAKIYGKVDCYSQTLGGTVADAQRQGQEIYVGLFKFLEYLQTQGETELVTYYAGSGSLGTGKDYWDTANSAGSNAFSVWKMKANGERNWDWYLYIHANYATSNFALTFNSSPTRAPSGGVLSATAVSANCSYVMAQAAFSISGSSSINPWNGTIDLTGAAAKTTPVWTTGSSGYSVHVLPRLNGLSGSGVTEKDGCLVMNRSEYSGTPNVNFRARYHFMYDGHGLLFVSDASVLNNALPRTFGAFNYIGPFRLNDGIVEANNGYLLGGSGSLGFIMINPNGSTSAANGSSDNAANGSHIPENSAIGFAIAYSNVPQGGVFASSLLGARTFYVGCDTNMLTTTYYANDFMAKQDSTLKQFDERMYSVFVNETPYFGQFGFIDTPLFRVVGGEVSTYDISSDKKRTVISPSATTNLGTSRKITIPWNGTTVPGTNTTRDGILFSDLNYSW